MKKEKINRLFSFFAFFDMKKRRMVYEGLLLLLVTVVTLIQPRIWAYILDGLFNDKSIMFLVVMTIVFFVSQITELILSFIQNISVQVIQQRLIKKIRLFMLKNVMNMDALKFLSYDKGELISRLDSDTDEIANGIVSELINLIFTVIKVIVIAIFLFITSFWLAIIVILLQLISFFVIRKSDKKLKNITRQFSIVSDEVVSNINMLIRGQIEINNLGINKDALTKSEKILERKERIQLDYLKGYMIYQNKTVFFNYIFQFSILLLGIVFIKNSLMDFYSFVAFSSYSSLFATSITTLYGVKASYINCFNSLDRFDELVGSLGDNIENSYYSNMCFCKDNIKIETYELKDLSFSYDKSFVFSELNICFRKGRINYIVGNSGCGKTTLLMVILGIYKATNGKRFLNGKEIQNGLIPKTVLVGQDSFFFDDTILYNLQIVNKEKTYLDIEEACKKANILDELQELPNGIETKLNNNAANLSYGQRQRLAIARILLLDSQVLLCDEILSNVDIESKNKIILSLRTISKDKLVIFVTHDSSLILENDSIFDMSTYRYKL